jgi:hypothetical protein
LCTAACGEQQLIGIACPPDGCPATKLPPGDCGAQFRTKPARVPANAILNRCELFTLEALEPAGDKGQVYLTSARVTPEPFDQHVEVRLAPVIEDFEDGVVECTELYARAVDWIPLLTTTQHGNPVQDLSRAPLVARRSHRLLIIQDTVNKSDEAIDVSVVLDVACAATPPAAVSQAFEFSDRERLTVPRGAPLPVEGNCVFDKEVLVWNLYRRTHLISGFRVVSLGGADGGGELVWDSGPEWTLVLDPPRTVPPRQGFSWTCTYYNEGPLPVEIGGDSPDACALLGFYQLPGGGEDERAERCSR